MTMPQVYEELASGILRTATLLQSELDVGASVLARAGGARPAVPSLSFRSAVTSREESVVELPEADSSPINRLRNDNASGLPAAGIRHPQNRDSTPGWIGCGRERPRSCDGTTTGCALVVIPKRGYIARGICCGAARSRFLADKSASE